MVSPKGVRTCHRRRSMPAMRKPYPSDLTDAQWAIIEPLIPVSRRRPAPHHRHARGPQRHLLPQPLRLPVGHAAARPAGQEHRLRLLRPVARRRHLAGDHGRPAPRGPRGDGPRAVAVDRLHRQPDGQGDRGRRRAGLRRGQEDPRGQATYRGGHAGLAAGGRRLGGLGRRRDRRAGGAGAADGRAAPSG